MSKWRGIELIELLNIFWTLLWTHWTLSSLTSIQPLKRPLPPSADRRSAVQIQKQVACQLRLKCRRRNAHPITKAGRVPTQEVYRDLNFFSPYWYFPNLSFPLWRGSKGEELSMWLSFHHKDTIYLIMHPLLKSQRDHLIFKWILRRHKKPSAFSEFVT